MSSLAASQVGTPSRYHALLELGQGGTAVVYLAVAQGPAGFNKLVVLKALKTALANDPEYRRLFLNEARLSARLNHPNIVQVYEVTEQDGVPVLVMEYLEGQPLLSIRTRAGSAHWEAIHLRILSEALNGLRYSHELKDYDGAPLNLVHRDMTPHNVFVTYEGQVKILDFGIAKLVGGATETETGIVKGKLRYMPPEQIAGEKVDRRTDIFAVGVMLWEAAVGKKMWSQLSEATIMTRVLRGEIPSPRQENPDVSPELERIVMKALAPEPDDRYATTDALQADIDAYLATTTPVTTRDIGHFVSQLFADSRQSTSATVEEHLRQLSVSTDRRGGGPGPVSFPPGPLPVRPVVFTESTHPLEPETRQRPWRSLLGVTAAASTIAVVATLLWAAERTHESPAAVTMAQSAPTPAAASPDEALETGAKAPGETKTHVSLKVIAFPPDAVIYLDDALLSGNPASLSVPLGESLRQLRAEAPGYEPASTVRVLDRDTEVILTLTKRAPVRGARKKRASSAKTGCNPPYVFDENGFKTFKPECL